MAYDVGDLVRVSSVFTNPSTGLVLDPTVVMLDYKKPDGTSVTLTYGVDAALVRESAGHYHADLDITMIGNWLYRWRATGIGQSTEESSFFISSSGFP